MLENTLPNKEVQPQFCSIENCNSPVRSKGWCTKHYKRWYKHGDPLKIVRISPPDGLCTIEGCEKKHRQNGFCMMHRRRWYLYGDPHYLVPKKTTDERAEEFWQNVEIRGDDECWLWQRSLNRDGYGLTRLTLDGIPLLGAHRVALYLATREDPQGRYACHTCDNRVCCNPNHLYWGDIQSNNRDAKERNRLAVGESASKSKLSTQDVMNARVLYAFGLSIAELQRMFGLKGHGSMRSVINYDTWKHV